MKQPKKAMTGSIKIGKSKIHPNLLMIPILLKTDRRKKAPKSVKRADKGLIKYEKDHIHFKDGSALNVDGTWKYGEKVLTRQEIE